MRLKGSGVRIAHPLQSKLKPGIKYYKDLNNWGFVFILTLTSDSYRLFKPALIPLVSTDFYIGKMKKCH